MICAATDHQQQQCHQAYAGMTNAVLFGNKKVAARARKAPRGWVCGGGVSSPQWGGVWGGDIFHFGAQNL